MWGFEALERGGSRLELAGSASVCGQEVLALERRGTSRALAAVIAWRYFLSCTSPAANTPGTDVCVVPGVVTM